MDQSCSIEGCRRPVVARGWCGAHYRRWRLYSDPVLFKPKSLPPAPATRFWPKVRQGEGCWEWLAHCDSDGYGWFWLDGRNYGAHVVAWKLANGAIPEGLCVLHRCDNPPCVNPDHLFLGTVADNNADRAAKGRSAKTKPNAQGRRKPRRACSVEGCSEPFLARGVCAQHYREWRKQRTDLPGCSITGCVEPQVARTFCHKHYKRWQVHGDPLIARAPRRSKNWPTSFHLITDAPS